MLQNPPFFQTVTRVRITAQSWGDSYQWAAWTPMLWELWFTRPSLGLSRGKQNRTSRPGAIIKSRAPSLRTLWEGALPRLRRGDPRGRSLARGEMGLSTAVAVVIGVTRASRPRPPAWPGVTRSTHSRRW